MALPVHLWLVSLSRCHSRAIGVLFCRAFLSAHPRLLGGPEIIPGRDGRRRLRMGLALSHAGVPVHVWRCRRPLPYGGLDPLRRETSAATVAIHASGGRCSTRPCAHAVGPSSFSAVRRQVWLNCPGHIIHPRGRRVIWAETAAPVPLAFSPCNGRAIGKFRWVGLYCCSFLFAFV